MQVPGQSDYGYSRSPKVQSRGSNFSIGEMLNPSPAYPPERKNSFSGIAHHHPPGGKSSIQLSFGAPSTTPQQPARGSGASRQQAAAPQWQTSSRAASAAADLSYQLQLSQSPGRPPSAGRRAPGMSSGGMGDAGHSILAPQSGTPGRPPSNSGYLSAAGYGFTPPGSAGSYKQQFGPLAGQQQSRGCAGSSSGASGRTDGGWSAGSGSSSANGSNWDAAAAYGQFSSQMQQLIAVQQQQQQQLEQLAQPGGYSSSANGAYNSSSSVPDFGSHNGAGGSYGQQYRALPGNSSATAAMDWSSTAAHGTPRAAAAAAGGPADSAGIFPVSTGGMYSSIESGPPSPRLAQQQASLAGIPRPAGVAQQFSPSKGAFGGKTIVQPPGGHSSLNIFGGQ